MWRLLILSDGLQVHLLWLPHKRLSWHNLQLDCAGPSVLCPHEVVWRRHNLWENLRWAGGWCKRKWGYHGGFTNGAPCILVFHIYCCQLHVAFLQHHDHSRSLLRAEKSFLLNRGAHQEANFSDGLSLDYVLSTGSTSDLVKGAVSFKPESNPLHLDHSDEFLPGYYYNEFCVLSVPN